MYFKKQKQQQVVASVRKVKLNFVFPSEDGFPVRVKVIGLLHTWTCSVLLVILVCA